jgi:hypothetical protein
MQINHFQGVLPVCAVIFKAECLRQAEYIQKMHWFARLGRAPFNGSVLNPKLRMPCTLYQPQATCTKIIPVVLKVMAVLSAAFWHALMLRDLWLLSNPVQRDVMQF